MMDELPSVETTQGPRKRFPIILLLAFSMLLTIMVRRPDLLAVSIPEISRLLQFPAVREYLEATLGLHYPQALVESMSQHFLNYGDLGSLDFRFESLALGSRARYLLVGSSLGVSVIVPTWNEEEYLGKCLGSIKNQAPDHPSEVIVVDGGSTDRTAEIAMEYADKVLVEPGLPVGGARNVGAKEASGDILAFIDADTIACPSWLNEIVRTLRMNRSAVGVTGPTLPYQGSHMDELAYHIATGWVQRLSLRLGVPHVAGFNCAYRKAAFFKAGGFDERRQISEDIMLSMRIRHQGPILFNPSMSAYTSLRRIQNYGYPYLTTYYAINWATMLLFNRTLAYPKVGMSFPRNVVEMRFHFWPLLIGALVLVWGLVTLFSQLLGITLPISWWAIVAIIIGVWILSHAIRRA
jgi:glycosyltransferase involved in cell wall biosynthesis